MDSNRIRRRPPVLSESERRPDYLFAVCLFFVFLYKKSLEEVSRTHPSRSGQIISGTRSYGTKEGSPNEQATGATHKGAPSETLQENQSTRLVDSLKEEVRVRLSCHWSPSQTPSVPLLDRISSAVIRAVDLSSRSASFPHLPRPSGHVLAVRRHQRARDTRLCALRRIACQPTWLRWTSGLRFHRPSNLHSL